MDCKCLECDCNVIHDTVVNNTLKAMPSGMVIEKIASFLRLLGIILGKDTFCFRF